MIRAARQREAERQRQEAEQQRQADLERERFECEQRRLEEQRRLDEQERQAELERERFAREQQLLENERKARQAEEASQRATQEQQDALIEGPRGAGGTLGWVQGPDRDPSRPTGPSSDMDQQATRQFATKTVEAVQTGVEVIARHDAVSDLAGKAVKGLSATSKTAFSAVHVAISEDKVKAGIEVAAALRVLLRWQRQ